MPEFTVRTEEYWLHRVDYSVQAATIEEAMQMILRGEVAYDETEIIEGGDQVQRVCTIDGKELSESESKKLLAAAK